MRTISGFEKLNELTVLIVITEASLILHVLFCLLSLVIWGSDYQKFYFPIFQVKSYTAPEDKHNIFYVNLGTGIHSTYLLNR